MSEIIIYRRKGKNIGEYDGKTLFKSVQTRKHLFRMFDAWGIDVELMDKILVPQKAMIEIRDTQAKKLYRIDAETARGLGQFRHYEGIDGDHGGQIFIPRSIFTITDYGRSK